MLSINSLSDNQNNLGFSWFPYFMPSEETTQTDTSSPSGPAWYEKLLAGLGIFLSAYGTPQRPPPGYIPGPVSPVQTPWLMEPQNLVLVLGGTVIGLVVLTKLLK